MSEEQLELTGPEGLRVLAAWFDLPQQQARFGSPDGSGDDQVQQDLRRWADDMETAAARLARYETTLRDSRLRSICEAELAAARAVRGHEEDPIRVEAWTQAHGDRMRVTHPVRMLALLAALDEIAGGES